MDKIRLISEIGKEGLTYITSPDVPGLLVAELTPEAAMAAVPQAVKELETVRTELSNPVLKNARARLKELTAEISSVKNFIAEYERFSGEGNGLFVRPHKTSSNSRKEEVANAARDILVAAQKPITREMMLKTLIEQGFTINGKNQLMVLNTMIWRAGREVGVFCKKGSYVLIEPAASRG